MRTKRRKGELLLDWLNRSLEEHIEAGKLVEGMFIAETIVRIEHILK